MTTQIATGYAVYPTRFADAVAHDLTRTRHQFVIYVRRHFAHREPTDLFEVFHAGSLLDLNGVWCPEWEKRDGPDAAARFLYAEDEALALAHAHVDQVQINGRTLAGWIARFAVIDRTPPA